MLRDFLIGVISFSANAIILIGYSAIIRCPGLATPEASEASVTMVEHAWWSEHKRDAFVKQGRVKKEKKKMLVLVLGFSHALMREHSNQRVFTSWVFSLSKTQLSVSVCVAHTNYANHRNILEALG